MSRHSLRNRCLATAVFAAFIQAVNLVHAQQPDEEAMRKLFSPQALKDIFGDQAPNISFAELMDSSEIGERDYDIYVNDRFLIHQKVNIVRKENGALGIQIPAQVIMVQDLRFSDLPGFANKMPMDMIENLPDLILGSDVKFDTLHGTVHITIPENWYKSFGIHSDIVPPQRWTYGVPAAAINYRANVDYQRYNESSSKHGYLDMDGQFNFGKWRVFANGSFSYDDNDDERVHEFDRGDIYATRQGDRMKLNQD